MDRIKDSGSFDWGSTPHGFTYVKRQSIGLQLVASFLVAWVVCLFSEYCCLRCNQKPRVLSQVWTSDLWVRTSWPYMEKLAVTVALG